MPEMERYENYNKEKSKKKKGKRGSSSLATYLLIVDLPSHHLRSQASHTKTIRISDMHIE
jgi:hypothetical protein